MVSFHLDDLTEGALRKAAVELGIPNVDAMNKSALITAVKAKVSPNSALSFVPLQKGDAKGWRAPSVLISIFALLVAIVAACATWGGTITAIKKLESEMENDRREVDEAKRRTWQSVKVYDIIHRNTLTAETWAGLTFEEIRSKYTEEVLAEKDIKLGKDDLQPDELKRIIKDLLEYGRVVPTIDNKYAIQRISITSKDCMTRPSSEAIQNAILKLLATESGKYTTDKLVSKIGTELKVRTDDVHASTNCMKAHGVIFIDAKGIVWSAIEAPKVEIPNPMPEKK